MEVAVRKTITDLLILRADLIAECERFEKSESNLVKLFEEINAYSFYRIDYRGGASGEYRNRQSVDQRLWYYIIKLYQLNKYMLCTDYDKMVKEIDCFMFPEFTADNVAAWLYQLKSKVYASVQKLIEDVFERITRETYYTGTGYSSRAKKKRNNNGVDEHFIITTYDNNAMSWYNDRPTITDDLEKACYIIDGKNLPEMTIKNQMVRGKIWESENEYFKLRFCKNGNTHYWMKPEIRNKLNIFGAKKGIIGEDIKIKVFED